jgi:glycosyltransferase involved in cell wall biosynthesis
MLTVIIPTRDSERALVQTLAPLVAGATAGLITEVIVADAGSHDATAEVADLAGCRFLAHDGPIGPRLRQAAALARTSWLMFLRAGSVLEAGWLEAVEAFVQGEANAARFRRPGDGAFWRRIFPARAHPDQGLIIRTGVYQALGGHGEGEDAEAALLRRLGRLPLLDAAARGPIT